MNAAQQPITITAEMTPVINYALYQNELRVMRCVTVENTRETALERVTLSVSSVPAIIMPYTITLDYIPACNTFRVTDVELLLNVDELANLTEKMTCAVTVSLSDSSGELASQTTEISVLAFDEWQGAGIYPELLTSFVVPNHPALAQVISRAADFLGKWTGDPSFDAYQSQDVNRVLSQSAAIFEAICELQLIYCTAPASFEERGQRVRLCDAVLQQKMGNCLDLSLLYASCMEAVGLHPLLLLTRSHIFSGVWLEDLSFPEAVQYDASVVSKRLALGVNEIAVAESTMMVSGKRCSFDQARSHAEKQLNEDGVECVIDVHRARISGVRPLPQRVFDRAVSVLRPLAEEGRGDDLHRLGDAVRAQLRPAHLVGGRDGGVPQLVVAAAQRQRRVDRAQDRGHVRERDEARALRDVLEALTHEAVGLAADIGLGDLDIHPLGRGAQDVEIGRLVRGDVDFEPQILPQLDGGRDRRVKVEFHAAVPALVHARDARQRQLSESLFLRKEADAALHGLAHAAEARSVRGLAQERRAQIAAGPFTGEDLHFFHSSPARRTSSS